MYHRIEDSKNKRIKNRKIREKARNSVTRVKSATSKTLLGGPELEGAFGVNMLNV